MGRESTITFEQVAAVADTMKAAGINPTTRSVRERLGNTGGMGLITQYLRDWKAGQHRAAAVPLALPPGVQRAMLDYMGQELAAARAELEADVVALQQEVSDLANDNQQMADNIEGLQNSIGDVEIMLATSQGANERLQIELKAAQSSVASERTAAEAARVDLAKAQLRLEAMPRLESDLAGLRADLDQERKRASAAEQLAAVSAARNELMAAGLAEVEHKLADTLAILDQERVSHGAAAQSGAVAVERLAVATEKLERLPSLEYELAETASALDLERERRATAEQVAAVNLAKLETLEALSSSPPPAKKRQAKKVVPAA